MIYIFLEKGNEENQLEISKDFVTMGIVEGDIIEIGMTIDYTILSN